MASEQTLGIEEMRALYASGSQTPRQAIQRIVSRARRLRDRNIWIVEPSMELSEPYLKALEELDPDAAKDLPLYGIPFAIKDNIDLAGCPTTAGCPAYAYMPERSATVVERLVKAGAVPVGKTNLDQFATGLVGTRSPYGECKNALDPELISGGSSSGSAVAVALGLAAFALGTDTAGSGRVPAALNGIVGYKPPLGSWSTSGVVPACASLDCVTVFANSLADAWAVDAVAKGFDATCAWSRRIEESPAEPPEKLLLPESEPEFYGDFAQEYRRNWRRFVAGVQHAADNGAFSLDLIDTREFSEIASILYDGPWVAERWADLGDFVTENANDIFPVTRTILESGNRPDLLAADQFRAYHRVMRARRSAALLLEDAVMILPTAGGTFTRDEVRADPIATNSQMGLYTNHCNLCDLSALAMPAPGTTTAKSAMGRMVDLTAGEADRQTPAEQAGGKRPAGGASPLPFGVTLFGRHDAAPRLFALAAVLEKTAE